MSYILDALKRSEQERHQGELTPMAVDTIMYNQRPVKHQWWPYLLIVVLLINLGVYVYFQFNRDEPVSIEHQQSERLHQEVEKMPPQTMLSGTQKTTNESPSTVHPIQNPVSQVQSSSAPVKPLPDHILQTPSLNKYYDINERQGAADFETVTPAKKQLDQQQPLTVQPTAEFNEEGLEVIRPKQMANTKTIVTESREPDRTESVQTPLQSIPDNYELIEPAREMPVMDASPQNVNAHNLTLDEQQRLEKIPHLSDLPGAFQASIPDIRFNSHIYSGQPAERRVMINDLYLKEGQSFSGMRIETIGEFYIELEKQGQHFKLPVLRDWFSPR